MNRGVKAGLCVLICGLVTGSVMTANLCIPDFVFHLFEDGMCSATDQPYDVFIAFAFLGAMLGLVVVASLAVLTAFWSWWRPHAQAD